MQWVVKFDEVSPVAELGVVGEVFAAGDFVCRDGGCLERLFRFGCGPVRRPRGYDFVEFPPVREAFRGLSKTGVGC